MRLGAYDLGATPTREADAHVKEGPADSPASVVWVDSKPVEHPRVRVPPLHDSGDPHHDPGFSRHVDAVAGEVLSPTVIRKPPSLLPDRVRPGLPAPRGKLQFRHVAERVAIGIDKQLDVNALGAAAGNDARLSCFARNRAWVGYHG